MLGPISPGEEEVNPGYVGYALVIRCEYNLDLNPINSVIIFPFNSSLNLPKTFLLTKDKSKIHMPIYIGCLKNISVLFIWIATKFSVKIVLLSKFGDSSEIPITSKLFRLLTHLKSPNIFDYIEINLLLFQIQTSIFDRYLLINLTLLLSFLTYYPRQILVLLFVNLSKELDKNLNESINLNSVFNIISSPLIYFVRSIIFEKEIYFSSLFGINMSIIARKIMTNNWNKCRIFICKITDRMSRTSIFSRFVFKISLKNNLCRTSSSLDLFTSQGFIPMDR
ncbi:hypothetical protein AGLY_017245, partial [Aphis glycines]